VLPILAATIAASKTGDLTFLVTERGTPFVKESFGNWFREACRKPGVLALLTDYEKPVQHALRKMARQSIN
jgi:hypothetical protein